MFQYSYWLYNNAIPNDLCEQIIKANDWSAKETAKIMRKQDRLVVPEQRITNLVWHHNQEELAGTVLPYFLDANSSAKWNFEISEIEPIQIGEYEVGGHYDWHLDSFAPNEKNFQRKLSMTILLSGDESFSGGEFEFRDAKPQLNQGSVLVFPSCLLHKVNPVTKGVRYSAVAWANGPAFK